MGRIGIHAQGVASTLGVELPHQSGVAAPAGGRGDEEDIVVAPEAIGVAEGGEAGGGREARADDGDDAGGFGEVGLEGGYRGGVDAGEGGGGLLGHVRFLLRLSFSFFFP